MRTTFIFSILFFLLLSVTSFCRIKGTWRQVFPEENGAIPGPRGGHYMCSIGDQQVVMIGGGGSGTYNYGKETWLYDYKANTWTKLACEHEIDTYFASAWPYELLCQISKNRVICPFGYTYMFDLDSLKWFTINEVFRHTWSGVFLEENLIFSYTAEIPENIYCCGLSELIRLNPEEPFDSPDFLTREVINDEEITKQGPNYNYNYIINSSSNEKYFTCYNNGKIVWIPVGWREGDSHPPNFMGIEREIWNWLFLEQGQDTLPYGYKRKYSQLTNNATLMHYDSDLVFGTANRGFYTIEYSPETDQMSTYKIDSPGNGVYNCKMAQIKDGVVMLFGGKLQNGQLSDQTWIFEIDNIGIVDNMGDSVKIYTLYDNLYMLNDELQNATLYNILGQKVVTVTGDRLDLNPLPIGVYFLQYSENGVGKTAKVMKK